MTRSAASGPHSPSTTHPSTGRGVAIAAVRVRAPAWSPPRISPQLRHMGGSDAPMEIAGYILAAVAVSAGAFGWGRHVGYKAGARWASAETARRVEEGVAERLGRSES